MPEITAKRSLSGEALDRVVIGEMLMKNFERLPDIEQKFFLYGPMYLGGNAALAGLISNSLYRRALNINQALFASSLPMAAMPFLTTYALYNAAVSQPLLSGDLNCPSCCLTRGALVGLFGGWMYPILLAVLLNTGLAARYSTALLPEKGALLRFFVDLSRPVLRKMQFVVPLQVLFGCYMSSRHLDIYKNLAQITFGRKEEELSD